MIISIVLLVLGAVFGGLIALKTKVGQENIRLPLIFAGSFLFSITIIHILPEVFTLAENPMKIGVYILIGFFLQQFLEKLTSGVEHGHSHSHNSSTFSITYILLGLSIHSILEGSLLTHSSPFHKHHESYSLLIGILLHKGPAAFALVALFKSTGIRTNKTIFFLILFSLMSPLGLILGEYLLNFSIQSVLLLFAIVSGGFLHISTTIFVESSPNHSFKFDRQIVSLAGASFAVLAEFLM